MRSDCTCVCVSVYKAIATYQGMEPNLAPDENPLAPRMDHQEY